MFCHKCGADLGANENLRFCKLCGAEMKPRQTAAPATAPVTPSPAPAQVSAPAIPAAPVSAQPTLQDSVPAQSVITDGALLATVPVKNNGAAVRFFDDHAEYMGQAIPYSEIAVLDTHGSTSTTFAIIVVSSFDGYIRFTLHNGQKIKVKIFGFSIYGIGSTRSAEKLYPPLFNSAYKIIAKHMAETALAQIRQGATVNIAGIEINANGAVCKKLLKREPVYINRQNFGGCGLDGYNVRIVDREGRKLFSTSDDNKNALLLPYVMTALFGD